MFIIMTMSPDRWLLVVLLSIAAKETFGKTWADVKQCTIDVANKCHEKCKVKLDSEIQQATNICEQILATATFGSDEDCFKENGFDVKAQTDCWLESGEMNGNRRHRREAPPITTLGQRSEQLKAYSVCFRSCRKHSAVDIKRCSSGCSPQEPFQQAAIDACNSDQSLADSHSKNLADFVSCIQSASTA